MKAFDEFSQRPPEFWALVKFVSQMIGYTIRKQGALRKYTKEEIKALCKKMDITISETDLDNVYRYLNKRADFLNDTVRPTLMKAEEAKQHFFSLQPLHTSERYKCKLPMNKQKGAMKQIAFFTAIINILTEKTIREVSGTHNLPGFVDDPQKMIYILNGNRELVGGSSRRFDGAYPSIENPKIVWEIKEYYYNKSFGSRIADGVYETQLDGYEFHEIHHRTHHKVYHVLFIDSYKTWWEIGGRPYLCRIVDALNMGLVDEVIVGREVFTRWPELLKSIIPQ